jgi:hypothetical protein
MERYKPRIVDALIKQRLGTVGAVVLEGARGTGKTVCGQQHAKSVVWVDEEVAKQPLVADHPELMIAGETPRLLDEWQTVPRLWNLVRREVDRRQAAGQFILTGSAMPADDITRHSGAGRFGRIRMRPFTLFESMVPRVTTSIAQLLRGEASPSGTSTLDLHALVEMIMTGGWPALLEQHRSGSIWVRDYVVESTRIDLAEISTSGRRRDPVKIDRVLRSIARSIGSAIRISTILQDAVGTEGSVSRDAVESYLEALRRVMLIEEVPAWQPHIRSATSLRVRPKLYFVDPSIGPAALQLTMDHLIRDLKYVGQLFENLVMRDVQVYAQAHGAKVSYYRDDSGLEIDAVIEGQNGNWIAMEYKLGAGNIDAAASNLLRLAQRIDTSRMGTPSALVVVTGSGYAFTRPDGVHVIPVELLGP